MVNHFEDIHVFRSLYPSTRTVPRIQWLLDYSGQVALAGSQAWWSNDVRMVFQRLEDGFESVHKDYKKKRVTCGSM